MQKTQTNDFVAIANNLIILLKNEGIESYIWAEATTGSVYIRFNNPLMNSIRIANHEGRKAYKYKFNIRSDMCLSSGKWKKDNEIWRYYLPIHLWKEIIPLLKEKFISIQGKEIKYNYNIPKFKQKI